MAGDEYSSVGGGGKLKLKGSKVKDGRVDKSKKKKKHHKDEQQVEHTKPAQDATQAKDGEEDGRLDTKSPKDEEESGEQRVVHKTEAERKYEEKRRKRLNERLLREGVKTHKERVEDLNRYLSTLSEHHDMPKIGPG